MLTCADYINDVGNPTVSAGSVFGYDQRQIGPIEIYGEHTRNRFLEPAQLGPDLPVAETVVGNLTGNSHDSAIILF